MDWVNHELPQEVLEAIVATQVAEQGALWVRLDLMREEHTLKYLSCATMRLLTASASLLVPAGS